MKDGDREPTPHGVKTPGVSAVPQGEKVPSRAHRLLSQQPPRGSAVSPSRLR